MDKVSLIYKMLSGEASPEEKLMLDHWIKINESNQEEFDNIKLLWENAPDSGQFHEDSRDGMRKIRAKIRVRRTKTSLQKTIGNSLLPASIGLSLIVFFAIIPRNKGSIPKVAKFNNASLETICDSLEKQHDVAIEFSPRIAGCKFSATFYNSSPDIILTALSEKLELTLERNNRNSFRLTGTHCPEKLITH